MTDDVSRYGLPDDAEEPLLDLDTFLERELAGDIAAEMDEAAQIDAFFESLGKPGQDADRNPR